MSIKPKNKVNEKKNRRGYKEGDYQKLAEEIIRPAKEKRQAKKDVADKAFLKALTEWKALPLEKRKAIRRQYTARGEEFSPVTWFAKRSKATPAVSGTKKRGKVPTPPSNPYAALLAPVVIVPDNIAEAIIIADAGSIIRLMDQSKLYREWMSPVTRRGDELLIQYGNAKKLKLGWITNKLDPAIMKPIKGPTFLVMTKSEDALTAWDRLRLLVARARKNNGAVSLGPWLATYGEEKEHQPLLREVTRQFGGTTVKNEPYVDRFNRLCQLILHTELDMALQKKSKKAKTGTMKSKKELREARGTPTGVKTAKSAKKSKKTTKPEKSLKDRAAVKGKKSSNEFSPRAKTFDNHVIRRLIKENPRRAGTTKFKLWAKIHKGMTVKEFITKYAKMHATRAEVGRYIQWGWIKLLPPSSNSDAE